MKVWVKICGVSCPEDGRFAAEAGADAIGINFWPGSRRFCPPEAAREIVEAVGGAIPAYGVFVDHTRAQIEEIVEASGIQGVQLHGGQSGADARAFGLPVILAVPADSPRRVSEALAAAEGYRVLLDTPKSKSADGGFGGSGVRFADAAVDGLDLSGAIVAGGLNPANVGGVVRNLRPFGVDTAGGVEREPGRKDRDLVKEFVDNAKSA